MALGHAPTARDGHMPAQGAFWAFRFGALGPGALAVVLLFKRFKPGFEHVRTKKFETNWMVLGLSADDLRDTEIRKS